MVDDPRDDPIELDEAEGHADDGDEAEGHADNGDEAEGHADNGDSRAPNDTHRESAYLKELVESQAPVEVKLRSGETVSGFVEYYDKRFIRLTRTDGPNLFIFKSDILYLSETSPDAARREHLPGKRRS